jgi:putative SOS response-associated peptidase YedK
VTDPGKVEKTSKPLKMAFPNQDLRGSCSGRIYYFIRMKDNSPFVFAGLWEGWKDPSTSEWLRFCSIIADRGS